MEKERTCILEWGYNASSKKARHFAQQHDLPYATIEDGFLRSIGLGVDGYPPFSLVYDDIGIYYDINSLSFRKLNSFSRCITSGKSQSS